MGKILRFAIGGIFVLIGAVLAAITGYRVLLGEWIWITLTIASVALAASGIRLMYRDKLEKIIDDLLHGIR